ncbi:MAG: hypothetical protein HC913_15535 [Microscillaceae bacterium]|nr:hypothetical protein [Microscillaceae bacterium]
MSIFKKIRNKDSKVYKVRLINKKTEAVTDKEVLFNNKNGHVFITQESAV